MSVAGLDQGKGWAGYRRVIIGLVGGLILGAIAYFGATVRTQLYTLATANSDNIQWNMSQAEVEHLAFTLAVKEAMIDPQAPLDQVRRRFDVVYSRVSTLQTGALYAELRQTPTAAESLSQLRGFLDRTVVFMDGDDAALRAQLAPIAEEAKEMRRAVRRLALKGISHFSALKDQSRADISRTLVNIAVLSSVLFVLLCLLVLALNKLNRINQHRAHQTELDSSRLSAIVTTSLDAIIVVSGDGTITEFNGAAEEIFGYARDEVIGMDMAEVIIPDALRGAHTAGMQRYLADGSKHVVGRGRIRTEARRKSGAVFPIELSIQTARGEGGEIFVSYIRDISKEVDAENQLRAARDSAIAGETSKARLLAVMSHEMRTPLNGLLGALELLSKTQPTAQQNKYLGVMEKSGRLLLSHVNDVLDISRLEAGNIAFESTPFDLNDLIRDVLDSQSASARTHANTLIFDAALPEFPVTGDPTRLKQVLLNLVGNAIKFTHNGHVIVEAELLDVGGFFEIRVIDDGIGIAEENIEKIFDDFITLDGTYARKSGGTGLGLGIVRRIVGAMGGAIGVESEPGEGSLFWVRLPVELVQQGASPSPGVAEDALRPAPKPKPLDILLVEDNEINRMVASEFLAVDGHRVVQATDGLEGVALANQRRFDLILMDISMPEIDGIEATRRIRAGNGPCRDVPIAALTAHALGDDLHRFKAAGMRSVISKPVTGDTLRSAVARLSAGQAMDIAAQAKDVLLDADAISDLEQQLGKDKFSEVVQKFCAEMDDPKLTVCPGTATQADMEHLAKTAHKLAGAAALMGASRLCGSLKRLEHAARAGEVDTQMPHIQDVEAVWQATRSLILHQPQV